MVGKVGNMMAIYDLEKTELIEIENNKFKTVKTLNQKVRFMTIHGDRLILDE